MLGTYTPYIWQCQAWHIHLTVGNAWHVIHLIVDNIRHGMCTYSWQCHACHTHYSWQCHTGHSFYSWQCQVCHTPYSWQQQAWCVYLQLAKPGMSYTLQLTTAGMASVPYSWQCQHVRHLTDDNIGHHIYLTARNIKQPYTLQFTRPNTSHTLQLPTSACHTPYSYKHQASHSPYCWQHPACHNSYSWQTHEHNTHKMSYNWLQSLHCMGTSYTSHFNTVLIADADTSNTLQLTMLPALQHRHLKCLKTETPYKSDNLPFANSPGTALSTDKHQTLHQQTKIIKVGHKHTHTRMHAHTLSHC